jgi:hypothetical protein
VGIHYYQYRMYKRHQAYWVIQTSHLGDYDNVTISLQLAEKSLSCLYSRLLSLLKICLLNNKIQYVDLTHQLRQYFSGAYLVQVWAYIIRDESGHPCLARR